MAKKQRSTKKETRKATREKERKLINENTLDNEYIDTNEELDNDFFMDDGEDVDYRQLNDEEDYQNNNNNSFDNDDLEGSNLDYDDELEYSSEDTSVKDDFNNKKTKPFKLSLDKYKSIKSKALKGSAFHINQCINIFVKILNTNDNNNIDVDNDEDTIDKTKIKQNILLNKKYCINIIKFCLKDVPELLEINYNKILIKRYLSSVTKFVKNGEFWDSSLILCTFESLKNHIKLLKTQKRLTELTIKLGVKYWLELSEEEVSINDNIYIEFLKEVAISGEYDFVLKSTYLGFLTYAKSMNKSTCNKINYLCNNILYLLSYYDEDIGYKNVFMFLRKITIELNRTINDKKLSSIKTIYNWQVINSLMLWGKLIEGCYKNNKNKDSIKLKDSYKLLLYPYIQIVIGVLRLHNVPNFIPLKLNLLKILINLSNVSNTYIPLASYFLDMLEYNVYEKYYKDNVTFEEKFRKKELNILSNKNLSCKERKKAKLKLKKLKEQYQNKKEGKHFLSNNNYNNSEINNNEENFNDFKANYLHVSLKIKEFKTFTTVKESFNSILDVFLFYLSVVCNKVCFPEIVFPINVSLKKLIKSISHNELKEKVKNLLKLIDNNSNYILDKRDNFEKQFNMKNINVIGKIEDKLKLCKLPIKLQIIKNKKLKDSEIQAQNAKLNNEFIDI